MSLRTSTDVLEQANNYEPKKLTAPRLSPIAKSLADRKKNIFKNKIEDPTKIKNQKIINEVINRKNEEIFI